MNAWIATIACLFYSTCTALAANQSEVDEASRMLLKQQHVQLRYDAKKLTSCVSQGLRRWTQRRLVVINWNQSFPPVRDIAHTGDAQYRMLFFAKLSRDTTLLCFQNNTGIGAAYHALFFLERNRACDVKYQFSFAGPVWSLNALRAAIIENAQYEQGRNRKR